MIYILHETRPKLYLLANTFYGTKIPPYQIPKCSKEIYRWNNNITSLMSMNGFVEILNNEYQEILRGRKCPEYHKFFESHEWFLCAIKNWYGYIKKDYPGFEYDNNELEIIPQTKKCSYVPKKIATQKMLNKIYSVITNPDVSDFNIIRDNIDKMSDYLLPTNIPDMNNFLNSMNKEHMNIIIVGAGPIGLFTALYLNELYNRKSIFNTNINILVIDNRIYQEGTKMPYSRTTQFGFDISEIQPFINQIFCWKNKIMSHDTRQFDFINVFENMLYIVAYHYKIPMYFTKKYETFEKIKEFATKNNFKYIFDCTGGRLETNFKDQILWNKYLFKKDNYEVKLDADNYYRFYVDNLLYEYITIVLSLFDKNMKQIPTGNMFGFTENSDDKVLLKKYKSACFNVEDYIDLSKRFKDKYARNLYPYILNVTKINSNNVKYIKLDYFNSNSHHSNICAKVINKNLTYIALGDTLGNSEYGIFFGLRDNILFSKYICNILGTFHKYRKYKSKYLDLKTKQDID
ncbi:putative orfan [Tupanvirus soda lake]|uniref:Orfan n=2 Tax=Tupanvirus TaxID=2094720 RepID=A0AC62AD57_9VIRU|nr:putative orfan [Tupanvirus soda lake]QKU35686.1 putative orfan [Tupanvirus soda lake]